MEIRRYKEGEEPEIWSLFYDTVYRVNSRDYTPEQIEAWAPSPETPFNWNSRLKQKRPFVAIRDGRIVGFAELDNNGHIDCFYCAHDLQGNRIGTALFSRIEEEAKHLGLSKLFTEASITAVGFFKSRGFEVSSEQVVQQNGVNFTNYKMVKYIK